MSARRTTSSTPSTSRPTPGLLRLLGLAAAAAALLAAPPARACSVCGCGDPLLTSGDPAAINGTLRLQLDVEHLRVDAGTDGRLGFTDQLSQTSYRLNAVYRPAADLSLTATLPLVSKRIQTVGGPVKEVDSDLTGLGDAELGARWALWRSVQVGAQRSQELALGLGTSLPTGAHGARMPDGSLLDPHGQLGTGAWGPFATAAWRLEQGDWTVAATLGYRIRTEGRYFDGSRYRFGNAWLWSLHGQYLVARRLALDLGLDGRAAAADKATDLGGAVTGAVDNTGGSVLSLAPGAYLQVAGGLWAFARAQVPVYRDLFGEQDVKPSFTAGLQYLVW